MDGLPDGVRVLLAPLLGDRLDRFLAAGQAALALDSRQRWVQVGLTRGIGDWRELAERLDDLASGLLADPETTNFFFMRKPPGLRIRFETAPGRRRELTDELSARLESLWPLVERIQPGVYEPEELLFGGAASMGFVHWLFTVDSCAWLAFHRLADPTPTWVFSLLLLRCLFDGLGIVGWEDLEVWSRIHRQAGRTLPVGMPVGKVADACAGIRAGWSDPGKLREGLSEPVAALVDTWGPRVRAAAADWSDGYFATRDAVIGPREGAAFATVFHWNRGGIGIGTQSLLTAALGDRSVRP